MLRRADSLGVFQVESRAQMNMLPRLRPRELLRPGGRGGDRPARADPGRHGPPLPRRRQGIEEPEYPSPAPPHGPPDELERVLGKTLGVPLFQEQAMRLAIVAAGFTPEEADQLRRAMATFKLTGGVAPLPGPAGRGHGPARLRAGFRRAGVQQIEGFGSYGFPESHAASFAHLVYASAWMKCHHPAVFACALLNSQPMGFYAPAQIVRDAREHGVDSPAGGRERQRLGQHPGAAAAAPAASRCGSGCGWWRGCRRRRRGRSCAAREARNGAPFASVEEAAPGGPGWGGGRWRRWPGRTPSPATGRRRRGAGWEARGVASGPRDLPLFAIARDQAAAAMAARRRCCRSPPRPARADRGRGGGGGLPGHRPDAAAPPAGAAAAAAGCAGLRRHAPARTPRAPARGCACPGWC